MPQVGEVTLDERQRRRIWLACEECGKERWVRLVNNEPRSKLCKTCYSKKLSKELLGNLAENSLRWKGGETLHGEGYVLVRNTNHPHSNQAGYVPRARLVLEKKLGRFLLEGYEPHHLNGIRQDDRPENLIEISKSEHQSLHMNLRKWKKFIGGGVS